MLVEKLSYSVQVPVHYAGYRVDQAASLLLPDLSRTRLRNCILTGELRVNNKEVKPAQRLVGSEWLEIDMAVEPFVEDAPEDIDLNVVYEDECILVINKPAGLVVHPAVGNRQGTLLNALLFYDSDLSLIPRAGIVHRLDKDTSGLLVVARNERARQSLIEQLKAKSMSRIYKGVCHGRVSSAGFIDEAIDRHPVHRKKMAVVPTGKPAKTIYEPESTYDGYTLMRLQLTTGRTHQIRVHMHSIGHPLVGDSVYGGARRSGKNAYASAFPRQALHAISLSLKHPFSGEQMQWQTPLPEDITELITQLEKT